MGKSLLGVAGISLAVALVSSKTIADGVSDELLSQDFLQVLLNTEPLHN